MVHSIRYPTSLYSNPTAIYRTQACRSRLNHRTHPCYRNPVGCAMFGPLTGTTTESSSCRSLTSDRSAMVLLALVRNMTPGLSRLTALNRWCETLQHPHSIFFACVHGDHSRYNWSAAGRRVLGQQSRRLERMEIVSLFLSLVDRLERFLGQRSCYLVRNCILGVLHEGGGVGRKRYPYQSRLHLT